MDVKLDVKEKQKASVCYPSLLSVEGRGQTEVLPKKSEQDEGRLGLCSKREIEGLWGFLLGRRGLTVEVMAVVKGPGKGSRADIRWPHSGCKMDMTEPQTSSCGQHSHPSRTKTPCFLLLEESMQKVGLAGLPFSGPPCLYTQP